MARLYVFLCIALLGLSTIVLRSEKQSPRVLADADVRQVIRVRASSSPDAGRNSVRLVEVETIPFEYDTQYFGGFKFDNKDNIYFTASYPDIDGIGRNVVVRYKPATGEYKKIIPKSSTSRNRLQSAVIQGFDVDQAGFVYIATANPELILVHDSDGNLISEIGIADFLPIKISVTKAKEIWVAGDIIISHNPTTLGQSQIRVYDNSGNRVGVPASGFAERDLSTGLFVPEEASSRFISGESLITYQFSRRKLARAEDYPYTALDENAGLQAQGKGTQPTRMLISVWPVDDYLVWLGLLADPRNSGAFGDYFIGLTSHSGQALTREIVLPREYGAPAGIDFQSNIYFISNLKGQMVLRKMRPIAEFVNH